MCMYGPNMQRLVGREWTKGPVAIPIYRDHPQCIYRLTEDMLV